MANYAIGDIQGCYEPLMRLLEHIKFNEQDDQLWLVGDLVNRGPQSLEVLRFIKNLPCAPWITLGNHDLHLLHQLFIQPSLKKNNSGLLPILQAEDKEELGHWLRKQAILHYDRQLDIVMTHAGIPPLWNLEQATLYAQELEFALQGERFCDVLINMYGNTPDYWSESLTGYHRLRAITNFFTRMRFCDIEGRLLLEYKGSIKDAPKNFIPWFCHPRRVNIKPDIVFGHWAALEGKSSNSHIHAIDTGCIWGGQLTALRLEDKRRFSVPG